MPRFILIQVGEELATMIIETLTASTIAIAFFGLGWALTEKSTGLSRSYTVLNSALFIYLAVSFPWTKENTHWGQWLHCFRYACVLGALPGAIHFIYGKRRTRAFMITLFILTSAPFHIFLGEPKRIITWPSARELDGGIVLQTTRKSCAAAAGASYLRRTGILRIATEAEVGRACHTDFLTGTKDKDLVAGLSVLSKRQVTISVLSYAQLKVRTEPCILFVGLSKERAKNEELYRLLRDECGWLPGEAHTVLFMGVEKGRPGEDLEVVVVADPRIGIERWGVTHFHALWDHRILSVQAPENRQ